MDEGQAVLVTLVTQERLKELMGGPGGLAALLSRAAPEGTYEIGVEVTYRVQEHPAVHMEIVLNRAEGLPIYPGHPFQLLEEASDAGGDK